MRHAFLIFALTMLASGAAAQAPQQPAPIGPAPVKPYKAVMLTLPEASIEPGFEAFRKQIGAAATRKDRAALSKLVVAKGFFWDRDNGDGADKRKSGSDNLVETLGLTSAESAGWDLLSYFAEDPTVSLSPDRKGVVCAPADPGFSDKELEALLAATQTDISEWGYPVTDGIEVRATPQASGASSEKLGLHFVRVLLDSTPAAAVASYLQVVTPSGKVGFVPAETIAPIGGDQICYVREGSAWKIGGYVGGGQPQ